MVLTDYKAGFLIDIICIPSKNKTCHESNLFHQILASVIAKSIAVIIYFAAELSGEDVRQASLCFKHSPNSQRWKIVKSLPQCPLFYNVYTLLSVCTRISMSSLAKVNQ